MIPTLGELNVNGKIFQEIKFRSGKNIYFYRENGKKMSLFYHKDSPDLILTTRNYNSLLRDLIEGKDEKINIGENGLVTNEEQKNLIIKYIDTVKGTGADSKYIMNLKKISEYNKKKLMKGYGLASGISLFEKLTLLISAVKAGHNGLEEDIKKVSNQLKADELISQEVYDKYKNKYFPFNK